MDQIMSQFKHDKRISDIPKVSLTMLRLMGLTIEFPPDFKVHYFAGCGVAVGAYPIWLSASVNVLYCTKSILSFGFFQLKLKIDYY